MTGDESRLDRRQISFDDVQVSATNSAGNDPKQNLPGFRLWTRNILDLKELSRSFMS
ncbi:MAG TPA: hypothetical protein VG714_01640 [Acidobacteriaceae bacterium]|nr:hypothetical protein [Acidobacteriaceae bacterium]